MLDAVGALRTPASHVMAYICQPVCGGASTTVCRFLYRDGDLTPNERMAIAQHIEKRVAEDTDGKYTVGVHCYDGEKGNVTGTLAGSEPQTVAALKKLANTEAKAAATRATAEAKRLEEVVEPGEVPKAGTGAERRAVLAKSLLAQEIRSAAVAQPFSRQPDARYGDGPMRREALDRLFSAEGDAGKAALLALLDAVERIAAEQCPQAGKNAYEIATGGWLPVDDAQSMGMLAAAFGPCAIVDRRQLVFLWRLQAAVFDTSISVRMLQEHLAQTLYERKRKDLYTQNPQLDLSVQLRVPNADGIIGIQDPDHKVKAVANAMVSSKDEVSGELLAKPDVVHAARGEGVLQKYLNGQLDKQKVALARFLFYCADLQANLTAAGHHDTAALMGVIAKFIQAWDMSGLTEGVRSRANEDLRVLLVALLGAEVHAVHINHASLKRRKASLPISLVLDLCDNIDGMQGMQASSPDSIASIMERYLTSNAAEREFAVLQRLSSGNPNARTLPTIFRKLDAMTGMQALTALERGFALLGSRKKNAAYAGIDDNTSSRAFNSGVKVSAPGEAPTPAYLRDMAKTEQLARRSNRCTQTARQRFFKARGEGYKGRGANQGGEE